MDLNNLLVEVRDSSLRRVGVILKDDLRLEATVPFNGVGKWTCIIRKDHPLAGVLASPGGGLVVTDLNTSLTLFSGPANAPEEATTVDDVGGTITVQGITDEQVLDDALAWPQPSNGDITTQTVAQDERTGPAETLMHQFVSANIGPTAATARKNLRLLMDIDSGRGQTITQVARFDTLLTLCQSIAKPDNLGFRVVQVGSDLHFQTFLPVDNARKVRLSVQGDGLASARLVTTAPDVTRALVAGKGGAVTRLFLERTTPESLAAEAAWGRRIERFVDQQTTRNIDEMGRAGDEVLAASGFTSANARFEPTEQMRYSFGSEWFLGDLVSLESNGVEHVAPISSMILKADSGGLRVGATLGDEGQFSAYAGLASRVDTLQAQQAQAQTQDVATAVRVETAYIDTISPNEASSVSVTADLNLDGNDITGVATLNATGAVHGNSIFADEYNGGGSTGAEIGNQGKLNRAGSSSRAIKDNIAPLPFDQGAFLSVNPVSYTLKAEADMEEAPHYAGFILEDVVDAGLNLWAWRNPDGTFGGLNYDRWTAGLHRVAQNHDERIASLEAENADLRDQLASFAERLAALEAA